ncbi:MAG: C40 family peptidase, partial [Myxococcota bacterium]
VPVRRLASRSSFHRHSSREAWRRRRDRHFRMFQIFPDQHWPSRDSGSTFGPSRKILYTAWHRVRREHKARSWLYQSRVACPSIPARMSRALHRWQRRVVQRSLRYRGYRYCRGGKRPSRGCFDCSGLVHHLYARSGYGRLPHGARHMFRRGRSVSRSCLIPGDAVFFSKTRSSRHITHVGIYLGKGVFIHAKNHKFGVVCTSMMHKWYAARYVGARRYVSLPGISRYSCSG